MSRRWILGLVVTVGAVGALVGATTASADFRSGSHGGEVLDRVASILGIERTELDDAFDQAKSEIKDEKQAEALVALVEAGTLSDAEAAEIVDWLNSRPSSIEGINPQTRNVFKFHNVFKGDEPSIAALPIPSISPELLARLVEAGTLTQDEADAIQAWLDDRPDAADKLVPETARSLEGIVPFGGGGFHGFDHDGEGLDPEVFRDGLRERLEQFREDMEMGDISALPDFRDIPDFNLPEGGFFQFDGDGFEFDFGDAGAGFFLPGGRGHDDHGSQGFRGFGNFERFHNFPSPAPESSGDTEPINLK
jgi:uncharacterized protein YggL (DUF469 family)